METLTPSEAVRRFNALIEEICRVLGKHATARFIDVPRQLLIWNRVMRLARLFASLAEKVRSGTLVEAAPARRREASVAPAEVEAEVAEQPDEPQPAEFRRETLPTHFRWLSNMLPEVDPIGGTLCWLMQRPEVEEVIYAAPRQAGRILRPLCKMLGVEPIAALRAPIRVPNAPVAEDPEAVCPQTAADGMCPRWREPGVFWEIDQAWQKVYLARPGNSEKLA